MSTEFIQLEIESRITRNKKQITFFRKRILDFEKIGNSEMIVRYQKVIERLNKSNHNLKSELDELIKRTRQEDFCFLEESNNIIIKQQPLTTWNEKVYKACEENEQNSNIDWKCMTNAGSIS